jgi:hypothetical protein
MKYQVHVMFLLPLKICGLVTGKCYIAEVFHSPNPHTNQATAKCPPDEIATLYQLSPVNWALMLPRSVLEYCSF